MINESSYYEKSGLIDEYIKRVIKYINKYKTNKLDNEDIKNLQNELFFIPSIYREVDYRNELLTKDNLNKHFNIVKQALAMENISSNQVIMLAYLGTNINDATNMLYKLDNLANESNTNILKEKIKNYTPKQLEVIRNSFNDYVNNKESVLKLSDIENIDKPRNLSYNQMLSIVNNIYSKDKINNKYKLTDKKIEFNGKILHQIEAISDFKIHGITVKSGDKGGYIENIDNLSIDDNSWVLGNVKVYDNARITNNSLILGNARIFENAIVKKSIIYSNESPDEIVLSSNALVNNSVLKDRVILTDNCNVFNSKIEKIFLGSGNSEIINSDINGDIIVCDDTKIKNCNINEVWILKGNQVLEDIKNREQMQEYIRHQYNVSRAEILEKNPLLRDSDGDGVIDMNDIRPNNSDIKDNMDFVKEEHKEKNYTNNEVEL